MDADPARWRSDIFGILPHPVAPRVLVLHGDDGWTLPHVRLARQLWLDQLGSVTDELRRSLGVPVRAYRYARYERDKARHREEGVYVLEWAGSPGPLPGPGRWIDRRALAGLALRHPAHRALLEGYFQEAAGGVTPHRRPPWACPGWFDEAAAWGAARLAERGRVVVGPIEQLRNWSLSCVLRFRTAGGAVYFKVAADAPLFVDEPALMVALAGWYPEHVPAPLAIDRDRRWMLLEDLGAPLGQGEPLAAQEAMLRAIAGMQRAAAARADDLLALGCADRRLDRLAAQIDPLLADPAARDGLADADAEQLRHLAPRLRAMCAELAAYRIPQTLVHGDLHGDNVAARDGTLLVFDWTDACLSHPFFDLMTTFFVDEATQARLCRAYLDCWTGHESPERLSAAWALARPLCALHHAVSYRAITASLEPRSRGEFAGDTAAWLRRVLQFMPEAGPA